MRWSSRLIAWFVLFLMGASVVRADDTHYRGIPVGAHSIALGGAFTGVADDGSAAFYNPAGLVLQSTYGIAGGLTVIAWDRMDVNNVVVEPEGSVSATTKQSRTVPIYIAAVIKFGKKDALGRKRFALAYSVVQPLFSSGSFGVTVPAQPEALTDTYTLTLLDRATWYGASFAARINERNSVGFTLYTSTRRLNHTEVGIAADGGTQTGPGMFTGTNSAASDSNISIKAFHFVFRLGWLHRIRPNVQIGLMVQPPGIPLRQRADVTSQFLTNLNTDPTTSGITNIEFLSGKFGANMPVAAEIEAGIEYWPADQVMLAFDVALNGPVKGQNRVEVPAGTPARQVGGLFFDQDTKRRPIGNVALGADFIINRDWMIETAFFTDLSAAPNIPANPTRFYATQINRFAGTVSAAFSIAGVSLAVGTTYLHGKGDATGVSVDVSNFATSYQRTDATSRTIYLHVTGATRAATEVSEKTETRIQRLKDQRNAASEDDSEVAQEAEP